MDAQRPGQKEVTKEAHHASEMRMCRHMQSQLSFAAEPSPCLMSVSYDKCFPCSVSRLDSVH